MPLQATSGAASYDAFGGGVAAVPNYIEECFSTFLYTGNGSTQTITNGIDLAGEGGLVWLKNRSAAASNNLYDTNRGTDLAIQTNSTAAQLSTATYGVDQYLNAGFVVGGSSNNKWSNYSGDNYASWTFRKQPKFFDVVTYTGNGVAGRQIAHSLGVAPGMVVVKNITTSQLNGYNTDWQVYHRSLTAGNKLVLNGTAAQSTNSYSFGAVGASSFVVENSGVDQGAHLNVSGQNYVAYLFAHDTAADGIIQCGSTAAAATLGWEPQFLLFKSATLPDNWHMVDNMRGASVAADGIAHKWKEVLANTSAAETTKTGAAGDWRVSFNATGFDLGGAPGTVIYLAIRRPNKPPTSGTQVFAVDDRYSPTTLPSHKSGFPVDLTFFRDRTSGTFNASWFDRLRGSFRLDSTSTAAESSSTFDSDFMDGWRRVTTTDTQNFSWMFRRAPGFFDVVCYTGNGTSATTFSHNLQKQPELIIVKSRSTSQNWAVAAQTTGPNYIWGLDLNTTAVGQSPFDYGANMSATIFDAYVGTTAESVNSGTTYVAYLFATCAGVSKVGSYTGTGTTLQIDCGFTSGARFVLIKRTDSTGSWYVWDVARGISSGNDPYLLLNSTAAEVTNTDYIDAYSAGFEISSTAPAEINASGGSFIFLAIS